MTIQATISIGDICVLAGMLVSGVALFYGLVGKVDRVDYKVEELRRGRGLILESWPAPVRRCFGFDHARAKPSE